MHYRSPRRSALLIGDNLYAKNFFEALRSLDLELRFSSSGFGGIGEIFRELPEIVFLGDSIVDVDRAELCQKITMSSGNRSIPVICVYAGEPSFSEVFDAFRAGADDCFVGKNSTAQMIAKIEWLIMQKQSTAALQQYYSELKFRQSQTLDIVRATADLTESIDEEFKTSDQDGPKYSSGMFEERLDMALGMIRSLASILEQQIDGFDISKLIERTDAPNKSVLTTDRPSHKHATMDLAYR